MIKLLGAALIITATTWTGIEASRHFSERPRQLRQLKSALQALEAEIMFGHAPLHEASRKIGNQLTEPVSSIFATFANKLESAETTAGAAWEESLKLTWKDTALRRGEFEILKQFGETLGRHDRYSQQKQIILTMTHLEREEADACDRQLKYEKMVKSLGFLSGLLLIILLM
ncbi:stage III sporulation protein SpoAB [Mesobacillus campisalis]|uniref:Stage III sporulation protein SpoAB n=1 Tax=Mesobacillus campisalis TaxID=1408103 RepID=A0A0M2SKV4_9BACI|nr:stage III sporulation protein SpoIIIAB [Mesobacillus campisalis]KKK33230.1 stage III sporulation protein SpoAB [Mesobacillus campisalis]